MAERYLRQLAERHAGMFLFYSKLPKIARKIILMIIITEKARTNLSEVLFITPINLILPKLLKIIYN